MKNIESFNVNDDIIFGEFNNEPTEYKGCILDKKPNNIYLINIYEKRDNAYSNFYEWDMVYNMKADYWGKIIKIPTNRTTPLSKLINKIYEEEKEKLNGSKI